jgi:hypothetical protein
MKSGITRIALLVAGLLVHGYARTASVSRGPHLGIVEAVFEEIRPGVFTPRGNAAKRSQAPAWAHVRFPQPLEDGRTTAVAAVPARFDLQAGDLIQMRFAEPVSAASDAPADDTVTALVASSRSRRMR